jgi:hypothetical protein
VGVRGVLNLGDGYRAAVIVSRVRRFASEPLERPKGCPDITGQHFGLARMADWKEQERRRDVQCPGDHEQLGDAQV